MERRTTSCAIRKSKGLTLANSLTIAGIHAAYGAVRVIEDVSLKVRGGETVVLLGTNGNGKSTLMKCIMGMVRPSEGTIVAEIDGIHHDLIGRTTEDIVNLGIALVPEGRRLFPMLTVEENLLLRAPSSRAIFPSALKLFLGLPSVVASSPAASPAASNRCWRLVVLLCWRPRFFWSMSHRWDSPQFSLAAPSMQSRK